MASTSTLGPRSQQYLQAWRIQGYTGSYVPVSVIEADKADQATQQARSALQNTLGRKFTTYRVSV